jgi:hypothetical protein
MGGARDLAAKIAKGQIEADIEFHKTVVRRAKISWALVLISLICLILSLVLWQILWALAGLFIVFGNLVLMTSTGKSLVEHQCILPATHAYFERKKKRNG